jgi:hypothetical protein
MITNVKRFMQLPATSVLVLYLWLKLSSYLTIILEWKCLSNTDALNYYVAIIVINVKGFIN